MFNKHDISRNECQLYWHQAKKGYDWWWHSFTAHDALTGEEKSFYIEYFLCNPAFGKDTPSFGRFGKKPSYLMVKAGCWGEDAAQIHRFFGWKEIEVDMETPFQIKAKDCYASEDQIYGEISISKEEIDKHPEYMCQHGSMKWNLKVDKKVAFNVGYGAGRLFRELQLFEMFWHAEGMKTAYEGEVVWNGNKYIVDPETCYGYADKNWGKDFTSPWVWLSSNNLTSEISGKKLTDSVFDIGGGRPKIGPIALDRKLLSAFWYEGKPYEFNFSKFWTGCKTEFDCKETDTQIIWHVDQKTWKYRMITDITCEKKDMLLVNYEAPDGQKRHNRLWNGGNGKGTIQLFSEGRLIDRIHAENVGCEYGEYTPENEMFLTCLEKFITDTDPLRVRYDDIDISVKLSDKCAVMIAETDIDETFSVNFKDKSSLTYISVVDNDGLRVYCSDSSDKERVKDIFSTIEDLVYDMRLKTDEGISIHNNKIQVRIKYADKSEHILKLISNIKKRIAHVYGPEEDGCDDEI